MADRGDDQDDVPTPGPSGAGPAGPLAIGRTMADVAERSRRLVGDWLRRQVLDPAATGRTGEADPLNIGGAFMDMTARLMAHPAGLVQAQIGFWQDYLTLWQGTTRRLWGLDGAPAIDPDARDPRLRDPAWKEPAWKEPAWKEEVFDFIKQSYLLSARYLQDAVGHVDGLSPRTAQRVDFYARQFVEAMSPSNFLLTNPEILRRTAETGGDNLLRGLNNLLTDLERGRDRLTIRLSELDAFRLGETVGITPGHVVFHNELFQLIQYSPATARVLARPLMIVPDWTSKFYALDLRPRNSFVRWATGQGHTVFMLSWAGHAAVPADPAAATPGLPGPSHDAGMDDGPEREAFEDYMRRGVLAALEAILRLTGEAEVNAVGLCLGGTLLAATLAAMARQGDRRIASLTLLTTMLDFAESGELGVFIDEGALAALGAPPRRAGPGAPVTTQDVPAQDGVPALLAAGERGTTGPDHAAMLTLLRANDLIWSFVVNNYLAGNDPFPFDLLHWTCDATPVPAGLHAFYLRQLYSADRLARPDALTLLGMPIDLGRIDLPCYVLAARDDHITPWRSVYRGARHLGGECRFVLAASGHFAGVVNPPASGRYSHWLHADLPQEPDAWFAGAAEMAGSWWPDWQRWVAARDRRTVPARTPGRDGEAAPGSFVRGHAA